MLAQQELQSRIHLHIVVEKAIVVRGAVGQQPALIAPVETGVDPEVREDSIGDPGMNRANQHVGEVDGKVVKGTIPNQEGQANVHPQLVGRLP